MNKVMTIRHLSIAALLLLSSSAIADDAAFSSCRQHFPQGEPPTVQVRLEMKPRALCFDGFAVLHSGKSHTPIYVAERLNRSILAPEIKRTDRFYEEARLPTAERAALDDYRRSGFDRGHMAPAADMATPEAMAQSFSLANMVPQAPNNNRKAWAKIEKDVRKYVMRAAGDVYVFSGPVYDERPTTIGRNQVWVPRYLFKLVYDPAAGKTWAHWIENSNSAKIGKPISYEELVRRTGIQFLSLIGKS